MSILLSTISTNKRTNTTHYEVDGSRALSAQANQIRALIVGIKLAAGATAELIPKQLFGTTDADGHWGAGSQIGEMARAFKKLNPNVELWGIGIDELSGGTAGTVTLTIAGTSTAAGVISVMVDGRLIQASIPSGTAAAAAGPLLNTAIQAHAEYSRMQYTSAGPAAVVTLTRRWKGLDTNLPVLNYNPTEALPAGLTLAIAVGTPGAGNPDMAEIIAVMGEVQYDVIAMPFTDATNLGLLETELTSRYGGERQIPGVAYSAGFGSLGTLTTLGNSRNSAHLSIMDAGVSPNAAWVWAAEYAALAAKHYSVPSTGMTGSAYRMNVMPPVLASRRTATERNGLLYDGVATHYADDGGNVYVDRAITTYQTNSSSVPDATFLDTEVMQLTSNIRKSRTNHVQTKFEGWLLAATSDDLPADLPVMTPEVLKGDCLAQFQTWRRLGWVQGSDAAFLSGYSNEIDPTDPNRMRELFPPHLMNQFRGVSGKVSFILQALEAA